MSDEVLDQIKEEKGKEKVQVPIKQLGKKDEDGKQAQLDLEFTLRKKDAKDSKTKLPKSSI